MEQRGGEDQVIASSSPKPPAHLSEAQRATWIACWPRIIGRMTAARLDAFEAYCIERERWMTAEASVREHGTVLTLRNDKGEVQKIIANPALGIAQKSMGAMLRLAKALRLKG